MQILTLSMLMVFVSYSLAVFLTSRRKRFEALPPPDGLFYVFLVPCLNEELVVGKSLDRLLALPADNFAVVVIDDGSEDGTAEIVRSYDPRRVWLLQRTAPEARQGKGRALNAAFKWLRESGVLEGRRSEDVVVCILDADGRLSPNAIYEVSPYFRDPKAGAVQIGVRMYNAEESMLTRMQDFEFVTFTDIFQRARQRVGSVGLGGNGQFARMSALESLGDEPWTDCLTEDLDLGVRLLVGGWTNNFCPTAHVAQQAVNSFPRLIRQRSRWFQGHLQCWSRIPMVLRSNLSAKSTSDLVYHLSSPLIVLLISLPLLYFVGSMAGALAAAPGETGAAVWGGNGMAVLIWYLLAFGLAPFYGFAYWLNDPRIGFVRAFLYAHVFNLYSYLWFPAGWMAVARIVTRQRGWAKTARTKEEAPVEATAGT